MRYPIGRFTHTIEVKKSKFLAFLAPYCEFSTMMRELKELHPKARHFVYAYRYLNEFGQIVENASDDGEPKGTSGRPTLRVLEGGELIDCCVIVVRYFGGVMLGTGGLVKAYSDAVNEVIKIGEFVEYQKLEEKTLIVPYSDLGKIEYAINTLEIKIITKEFGDSVKLIIQGTKEKLDQI